MSETIIWIIWGAVGWALFIRSARKVNQAKEVLPSLGVAFTFDQWDDACTRLRDALVKAPETKERS